MRVWSVPVLCAAMACTTPAVAQTASPEQEPPPPPPGSAQPAPGSVPPPPGYAPPPPGYSPPPPGTAPRYYPSYGYAPPQDAPPPPPPPPLEHNSVPLMVGGIALISLGAIGVLTGIAMLQTASDQDCVEFPCDTTDDTQVVTGAVIGGIGLAAIGAGIPMTIVGAQRVASEQDKQPPQPEATPRVALGAGSLTLLWLW